MVVESLDEGYSAHEDLNRFRDTFRHISWITNDHFKLNTKEINKYFDWKVKDITVSVANKDWVIDINCDEPILGIRGEFLIGALIKEDFNDRDNLPISRETLERYVKRGKW